MRDNAPGSWASNARLRRPHPQLLSDAELGGIVQAVPLRNVAVVGAVLERDAVERVAFPDGVEAFGRRLGGRGGGCTGARRRR